MKTENAHTQVVLTNWHRCLKVCSSLRYRAATKSVYRESEPVLGVFVCPSAEDDLKGNAAEKLGSYEW